LELSIDGAKGVLFNVSGSSDLTMLEINEAANIITESIDPNAKVIFGAVVDETIKKGEVQVTVVATGFDTDNVKEAPMERLSRLVREENTKKEEAEEEAPKITFPVRKIETTKMIVEEKVPPRRITPISNSKELEEDDELEIPAFIRRKMGK
jgi:cell division protein FtsZ